MIVEFIGLPGVGKSSLREHLGKRLTARGIAVEPEDELRSEYIRRTYARAYGHNHPLRRPITALYKSEIWTRHLGWRLGRGAFGALGSRPARLAGYWLTEAAVLTRFSQREALTVSGDKPPIRLISEGFAHHFASCLVWDGTAASRLAQLAPYQPESGMPHLILFIEAPVEIALLRLRARGCPWTWPESADPASVLTAYQSAIAQTLDMLSTHEVRVERVDFGRDISTLSPELDALSTHLVESCRNPVDVPAIKETAER